VIQTDKDDKLSFFREKIDEKVNYINLSCSKGLNIKSIYKIFKLIIDLNPDIVHAHLNTLLYILIPSFVFKRKIKFFHTIHNLANKDVGFVIQKKINNFVYKNGLINGVAISKECRNSFNDFYGHSNIYLVENGNAKCEKTDKFQEVRDEINNFKSKNSNKVYIHVGRFSEQKNQKLLINVFNRFILENNEVELLIIGDYFDSIEATKLKDISESNIHYLGTKTNISDYLLNSDVFVLSSLWEGLPISLLEALSCGLISVCTPAGGITDVILDESVGYLSKDFSEEGLFEALKKCHSKIREYDRSHIIDFYNSHFSIELCAKNYLNIYLKN
jgi:glycosyltransferase involved in cell wall biosynthesis